MPIPQDIRSVWNFDDPATSEKEFDRLLDELPSDASPDLRAEVITQKARAQGLQRRFDDARSTLVEAKVFLVPGFTSGAAAYELESGRVENSSGNLPEARVHFLAALEIAKAGGHDFLAVDAAHMLGIVDKGDTSLDWNEKAIAMASASSDPKAQNWLGSLLNNTGWTYYETGDFDKAMVMFERALEFRIKQSKPMNILIARYCIAKCLRAQGLTEKALNQQLELEEEHDLIGNEPGFTYEEIAECLLALGRSDEARPYFAKAHKVLSNDDWLMASEPGRVARLGELAGAIS